MGRHRCLVPGERVGYSPSRSRRSAVPPDAVSRCVRRRCSAACRSSGSGSGASRAGSRFAVAGSALYGVMTVLTAWAIGKVTREQVQPAVAAGHATAAQLWAIFGLDRRRRRHQRRRRRDPADRRGLHDVQRRPPVPPRGHPAVPAAPARLAPPAPVGAAAVQRQRRRRGDLERLRAAADGDRRRSSCSSSGIVQMVLVDPVMAIIGLTVFPALFLANMVFQRAMSPKVSRAQQLRAEVSEVAHESFEAALIVEVDGPRAAGGGAVRGGHPTAAGGQRQVGRTRGIFDPVIESIPTLGTLAVLAVGATRSATGALERRRGRPGRLPVLDARLPGPGPRLGARRAARARSSAGTASTRCSRPRGSS